MSFLVPLKGQNPAVSKGRSGSPAGFSYKRGEKIVRGELDELRVRELLEFEFLNSSDVIF